MVLPSLDFYKCTHLCFLFVVVTFLFTLILAVFVVAFLFTFILAVFVVAFSFIYLSPFMLMFCWYIFVYKFIVFVAFFYNLNDVKANHQIIISIFFSLLCTYKN